MKTNKIGKESAFPFLDQDSSYGTPIWNGYQGMNLLTYLSSRMTDDFDSLPKYIQRELAGKIPGEDYPVGNEGNCAHAMWLATGRAKWRILQADTLIDELNKE